MRTDAEVGGKAVWAQKDDPRVTRVGRLIRKLRIDELPQAWSVLKGEMSFVGPRPERPQFVADLEARLPYYAERHVVKPGITGWAQINYPYGASIEDCAREARIRSLLRQELHALPRPPDPAPDGARGDLAGGRAMIALRSPCGATCSPPRSTARSRSASCATGTAIRSTGRWSPPSRRSSVWTIFLALLGPLRSARPARRERAQPRLPRLHVRRSSAGADEPRQRAVKGGLRRRRRRDRRCRS